MICKQQTSTTYKNERRINCFYLKKKREKIRYALKEKNLALKTSVSVVELNK